MCKGTPAHTLVKHSPYLPPQVSEADVELVLLAGLSLVAAAVLCTGGKGVCKAGLPQHPQPSAMPQQGVRHRCSSVVLVAFLFFLNIFSFSHKTMAAFNTYEMPLWLFVQSQKKAWEK